MRPLCIDCSPRIGGNSDIILDAIRERFDVDYIYLRDKVIVPCNGCDACSTLKRCVNKDDADRLYEDIETRDEIILIAPVYFYSFDAHTKAFIDRAQYMWSKERRKDTNRKVHLIAVGGQNLDDNFYPMERTAYCFALTIGAKYDGGIFFGNVDKAGDIKDGNKLDRIIDYLSNIIK